MNDYKQLFNEIKNTRDYKTVGEDIQYKVIVDDYNFEIILQFEESRGNDKWRHSDWWHNLMFLPFPLKLDDKIVWTTYGYACAYRSAKNQPIDEFIQACKEHPEYSWKIQGWSFGSAMTKIAVRHFYIRKKLVLDEEITYGDVKVWLNPFVHWLAKDWVRTIREFVCVNDMVTWCVPFYHRTNKCKLEKFSLKKLFNSEYSHTHYEEYDYGKY